MQLQEPRSHTILRRIQEAEFSRGRIEGPREMILMRVVIANKTIPSVPVFRQWLDRHGLGTYGENLLNRREPTMNDDMMDSGEFHFIFPRSQLRQVQELEARLAGGIPRLSSFEIVVYSFNLRPRSGVLPPESAHPNYNLFYSPHEFDDKGFHLLSDHIYYPKESS